MEIENVPDSSIIEPKEMTTLVWHFGLSEI